MPDLSPVDREVIAVIPTLADTPRLRRSIASLQRALEGVDAAIVVVLNSPSSTEEGVRDGVLWRGAGMNLGWAGGVHAGLLGTTSQYIWTIQDDLELDPAAYHHLRSALQQDPRLASVRPLLTDAQGVVHPGYVGGEIDEDGCFTTFLPPRSVAAEAFDPGRPGSYPPSSAQLIRREHWDALGGFDPWLYPWGYIDIDYGRTLTRAGHAFRIVAEARMTHAQSSSTNHPFREYLAGRNRWLFTHKWGEQSVPVDGPADSGIVHRMRAGRSVGRHLDITELQWICGIAAADCMLHLGQALPDILAPVQLESDELRSRLEAVTTSRAWRAAETFRSARNRVTRG